MTNREWLNSLSDEEFAVETQENCSRRKCLVDDDTRPDITNCGECFLDWLKQERSEQYITNRQGVPVRVPRVGEEVYIIEMYNNDSQQIRKIKWQEWCNLLYLLYNGKIFYSVDEAIKGLAEVQQIVVNACREAGWSKQVNYICGTPSEDDNPFD